MESFNSSFFFFASLPCGLFESALLFGNLYTYFWVLLEASEQLHVFPFLYVYRDGLNFTAAEFLNS